jgi:hypothetical protein
MRGRSAPRPHPAGMRRSRAGRRRTPPRSRRPFVDGRNATDSVPKLVGMPSPRSSEPLNAAGCLFCLRADGGFVSREHVFSEGFGNVDEKVLPPGVVCDRCNNGPLALADEELVNFPPISLLRAERGIPTKAGRLSSLSGAMPGFGSPSVARLNSSNQAEQLGGRWGRLVALQRHANSS